MNRRLFLQLPVAAHAISSLVVNAKAGDAVFVKADTDRDDKPFKFIDGIFHVKVSGRDTQGRCVIFDTLRPDKVGRRCTFIRTAMSGSSFEKASSSFKSVTPSCT
jgi:hypothetical protein